MHTSPAPSDSRLTREHLARVARLAAVGALAVLTLLASLVAVTHEASAIAVVGGERVFSAARQSPFADKTVKEPRAWRERKPQRRPAVEPVVQAPLVRSLASFPITRGGQTLTLPVYVSQSLTVSDARVTRAVIALHGTSRNAAGSWDYAAANLTDVAGVLLIAPRFTTDSDDPTADQLYWTSAGWPRGDASEASGRPWVASSYDALDEIVARVQSRFKSLKTVVLIGHSAGGQMVQRYASARGDAGVRFVVMNPGSYLYLSAERPDAAGGYSVPAPAPPGYDNYKYGLRSLTRTPYMAAIGAPALRSRYETAQVRYLLGSLDIDPNDPDLDVSAPALLQGTCRLERGLSFFAYLGSTYGGSVYERHALTVVPGVAHSAREMFGSPAARAAMTQ